MESLLLMSSMFEQETRRRQASAIPVPGDTESATGPHSNQLDLDGEESGTGDAVNNEYTTAPR
ncbi:MAG: hypothetical protein ACR2J8_02835 [Thermomicrobiales bacterium]